MRPQGLDTINAVLMMGEITVVRMSCVLYNIYTYITSVCYMENWRKCFTSHIITHSIHARVHDKYGTTYLYTEWVIKSSAVTVLVYMLNSNGIRLVCYVTKVYIMHIYFCGKFVNVICTCNVCALGWKGIFFFWT